ncbi:MAG: 3-coathanger stack domain-containing protein, partial [Flavobacteriales bacterium]
FEWVEEVRTFIAPMGDNFSNLSNLILRLCDDSGGAVYTKLLIDDVQLFEEDLCADIRAVENTIYWNETNIYQANIDLYAGLTVNQHTIDGPVVVKFNSNIIYRAGNQVVLEQGFSTESGCYFEAVIGPCENNPCPAPPFIPQSLELCGNTTAVLRPTSPPDVGLLFSWSPATYLDNPNSPNPTFTAPPGEGTMNYTLTVTSACGYLLNPRAPDVGGNQQAEMNPEAESFLSTENQEIAIGLHLFPNPSDGRLTIVHDHLMGEIQILDV